MVIAVDMDNTLNNFTAGAIDYALKIGVNYNNIQLPLKTWDIFSILYPDNTQIMADKIMSTPGFWLDLEPYPHSEVTLKYLTRIATVAIVTKPWNNYNCIPEKMQWIRRNYPFFDLSNVVFTWNKDLVPADYIIEDKPDNYKDLKGRKLILFDQEYNRNEICTQRVKSWKEIEEYFANIQ